MRDSQVNAIRTKVVGASRTQAVIQQIMEIRQNTTLTVAIEINQSAEKDAYTPVELLQIAVAENDTNKLRVAIEKIGTSKVMELQFDHGMNVLNLAIDQESIEVVLFLRKFYKDQPKLLKSLVSHRYTKEMQAIHQVMSLGHLQLI